MPGWWLGVVRWGRRIFFGERAVGGPVCLGEGGREGKGYRASAEARTWLGRTGWQRYGLVRTDEVPGDEPPKRLQSCSSPLPFVALERFENCAVCLVSLPAGVRLE